MNSTILFIFYLFLSISYSQNQINQGGQNFIRVSSSIPSSFDWRQSGQMTPVKDQKDCNAYYAFSTTAFFEQDLIINQGASSDIDLSQQFLTKCLPTGGCIGGSPKDAMQLVLKRGGIPTQSKYPYIPYDNSQSDICYPSQFIKVGDRPMYSFYDINNQQFLKQLILKQPLNIYICSADLKLYGPTSNTDRTLKCSAGNFNNDHTVLLVGYTETQWIIKNSWGSGWGINGYAYISRNSDNDCCIGSQVYLRGAKTNTSTCKIQNCQSCVQQNYCSKCKPGYYVATKDSKHSCVQCTLSNCAQCQNSVGYCRTCIYGYALYFPDKTCKLSVIQNCKNIVNGGCKDCHNGYKVTPQFKCQRECSIKNCQTCKDDKSCSQCVTGYELVVENKTLVCKENICKTENCAACNQIGKCIQCKGSYSLIEDSCVMICDKKNCKKCSEVKNQCQECNEGYALDFYSHQCVSTSVKNCLQSYLTKYCSICKQGYQRSDSWQLCSKICNVLNCKSCQVGRSNQCITCETGYKLLTPEGQSIPICQKNKCDFPNCTLCDFGSASCYQCIDKYHRWSASRKACVPFQCPLQNCNKCTTDAQKCQQCKSGTVKFISTGGCIQSSIQNCDAIGMNRINNQLQCWDCKSGYEVDYKTWKSCKKICIDANCIDCSDDAKICKTCLSGYGLKNMSSTNQTRCVKIAVYLPNCLRGNSQQTFCYQCKQFYFFNTKTLNCQPNTGCPTNCIKCTAADQDLKCECKTGMVWDFINKQCVKNPTDSNCLVISNYTGNEQCFQCKDRYTLTDDGKGCISDCAVSKCDQCVRSISENYPDYCSRCIGGYVNTPNMTRCVPCQVENCQTCKSYDSRKVCLTCKLGYQLKGDSTCKQIQCQQNAVFNGLQCACQNSYYKDPQNQQCKKCGTACKRCTKQDNCVECSQEFFLEQGKCAPCLQNCQKCQDSTTCKLCQQGFTYQQKNQKFSCIETGLGNQGFKLQGGKKVRCLAGCGSCIKDYRICQQCLDGYILLEDKCQKCQDNCKTCYTNILSACILCQIGSVLNQQGKCVKCSSQHCLSCPTTANICVQCIQGYYLKDQKCKSCGLGCKTCDKNGTCTQAESGFALVQGGLVEQCLDGCSKCQPKSLQKCDDECLEGNYISSENICTPCPQLCRICSSQKNCTKCITGYNLIQGSCNKMCDDSNCFDCSLSSNSCKQCFAGYKLDKDSNCIQDLDCNNIIPQQQNANETGSCKICPHRYFLQNGFCQQCQVFDTNCIACIADSPANCTQCAKKYYLEMGICNKCNQNCQTCRNNDYCYMCSSGYYMLEKDKEYSGICLKCNSNCLTCVDEPTKCLSCKKGYKLSVAKICMNTDAILYVIRLRLNFLFYSVNIGRFRRAFNQLFNQKGGFHFQIQKATSGSTILQGYISINPQTQSTQNITTFKMLSNKIRARQSIAGIQVESISLSYKGQRYSSDGSNDIDVNQGTGVEGWVIAVAVVGGVIGLVVLISVIVYIKKKVKAAKNKEEDDDVVLDSDAKNTQSNFKKDNPEFQK